MILIEVVMMIKQSDINISNTIFTTIATFFIVLSNTFQSNLILVITPMTFGLIYM